MREVPPQQLLSGAEAIWDTILATVPGRAMASYPLKFGEFELDPAAYELRRLGHPVRIERIPMELLLLLVSRNGALVSRVEIIDKLWGKDVFIDTNTAINVAVSKVRQA